MAEQIKHMKADFYKVAVQFGMSSEVAMDFSKVMIEKITHDYAGAIYIPKQSKEKRNEKIKEMFNGVNHKVICIEFGISKSTLYRIIGS